MICKFHVSKREVFIAASSIIAIMPDSTKPTRAVLYCDPPIEGLLVDESVAEAYIEWSSELYEITDDEEAEDAAIQS